MVWAGNWDPDPGDREILRRAHDEQRVLVTLDKDFGELAIIRNQPHSGIVRLVGFSARAQAATCQEVLARYAEELRKGALVTVDATRVRVRPAETAD